MVDAQTVVNLGTGGSVLNAQLGSSSGADSNDPKYLDWPGDNAGNYFYQTQPTSGSQGLNIPDAADLRITGDIDLRAHIALDDWTPASSARVLSKYWISDPNRGYALSVKTSGQIDLVWSTTGTGAGVISAPSTVAVPFTDGEDGWIRATLDVDNGAGGYDATFYTSSDGVTWTQLGAVVTGGSITNIYPSDRIVEFGSWTNGFNPMVGKFYRGQIYDGIDGTLVADVDTSLITAGSNTSFTARTGQTVTIRRGTAGRKSVAVVSPVWLFGTDDIIQVADNALLDFGASDSFTLVAVIRQWATVPSFREIISKRLAASPNLGYNMITLDSDPSYYANIDDGPNTNPFISKGYNLANVQLLSVTVDRDTQTMIAYTNATKAGADSDISSVGDISNPYNFSIGGRTSPTLGSYNDMELLAVAVYRRVLSVAEMQQLTTYYQNKAA